MTSSKPARTSEYVGAVKAAELVGTYPVVVFRHALLGTISHKVTEDGRVIFPVAELPKLRERLASSA